MKLHVRTIFAVLLSSLLLSPFGLAQTPVQPTPFSADMQFNSTAHGTDSHKMNGKIYMGPQHMRMDMEGGPNGGAIMITNFTTKTTDTLMPEQHMYMEFNAADAMAGRSGTPGIKPLSDPGNPCASEEGMMCKNLGVEQIDGRTCDHWQMTNKDGTVTNVWIDQKIHFPIKSASQDSSWTLTNIKEGEPEASLFEIPTGYQKMDMGNITQGMHPPQQ